MPRILSKRMKEIRNTVITSKEYKFDEAIEILKSTSKIKFEESIDVSVNLGVDSRKSDQLVRGFSILPHGIKKSLKIAIFLDEKNLIDEISKIYPNVIFGMDDLSEKIQRGFMDFDIVLATTKTMKCVSKLGNKLGPKGLMPNLKTGTLVEEKNIINVIENLNAGSRISYRIDKAGILHTIIGKSDFPVRNLRENLELLLLDLKKIKPKQSKGTYFKKITLSSTMGPGLTLDITSLSI